MEKGKLEKYWRLRLPIFIAFMIAEVLLSNVIYEYRIVKDWTPHAVTQKEKAKSPLEYLIKHR